jgi:hypothetical protein
MPPADADPAGRLRLGRSLALPTAVRKRQHGKRVPVYDLIGDIHGHADELISLLELLGYGNTEGVYRHPERKVIFLGDFIDRGPRIRQVLQTVRGMVEAGSALATMGNHELNALAFHTPDPETPGEFLRRHRPNNVKQHSQTVLQLNPDELTSYLDWFRTLPMWLELDGLRAVHACWDDLVIARIGEGRKFFGGITAEFLQAACRPGKPLFSDVEEILKGKEALLPHGISFADKDGHVRTSCRTRWYLSPHGHTYRTYAMTDAINCDLELQQSVIDRAVPYSPTAKPVFVGHYWLSSTQPKLLADNVACLDFSVAKGGYLCAYRWNGEQALDEANFWVV